MPATSEQIRTAVAAYIERFSAQDKDGYIGLFAPDATVEDPVGSEVRRGHTEIGEFWDLVQSLSERITLVPEGSPRIAAGEAAFGFRIVNVMGGEAFTLDAIDVMTFDDDGRITSMRAFWDMADMAPVGD